jgi:hypothetical protein
MLDRLKPAVGTAQALALLLVLSACGTRAATGTPTPAFDSARPAVVASVATVRSDPPDRTAAEPVALTPTLTLSAEPRVLPAQPETPAAVAIPARDTPAAAVIEPTPEPVPATRERAANAPPAALSSPLNTPPPLERAAAAQMTATTAAPGLSITLTAPLTISATATTSASTALPVVQNGQKRVLFVNGDHVPESGYPHSRVNDDGSKPESFSQLRKRVLEGALNVAVDEVVISTTNMLSATQLMGYRLVVLGSNGRMLTPEEVGALTLYANSGGRILVYADFQYGPNNWASDNAFLAQFNIEVFPDNFQPTTQITDVITTHPIMAGVTAIGVEGSSQFLISAGALSSTTVLAKCTPLERPGCALQAPELAKIKPGDVVACTWVRELPTGATGSVGRIAGTCDRNTFHNGPGVGSALGEFSNERYATNLFRWLLE